MVVRFFVPVVLKKVVRTCSVWFSDWFVVVLLRILMALRAGTARK